MAIPVFNFTRNPSVKVSVATQVDSLVQADNELIIIGRKAASGGSIAANGSTYIDNFGDPVAAAAECVTKFGASTELQEQVVAAISGVLYSNLESKLFPKIRCLVLASTATSADLAALFALYLSIPMPYVAIPFNASDSVAIAALKAHVVAISASDRGDNGQFGSFGFIAADAATGTVTPIGEAAASQNVCIPWLRDTAGSKANKIHAVTAAYAALCASLGIPFLPLNGVKVGGLVAPASAADYHTPGDAGTVALGLDSGLVPLQVNTGGEVLVSRSITTSRVVSGSPDSAYYDMQDWQVLYYLRKNAYVIAMQPRYKIAKATVQKLQSLRSELIQICKRLEDLEMLQHVDKFADQFTVDRQPNNRHAAVYRVPVNVVPGFHNKGIALVGTTQFDLVVA